MKDKTGKHTLNITFLTFLIAGMLASCSFKDGTGETDLNSYLKNPEVRKLHDEALKNYYNLDWDKAVFCLEKAKEIEPANLLINMRLFSIFEIVGFGHKYETERKYDFLYKDALRRSEHNPDEKLILEEIFGAGRNRDRTPERLESLRRKLGKEDVMLNIGLAFAYVYLRDDFDKAYQIIGYSVSSHPDIPVLYMEKCVLYRFQKRYDDFLKSAEEAVKRFPYNFHIIKNYSDAFAFKENFAKSQEIAMGLLMKNDSNPVLYYRIIQNYIDMDDPLSARKFIKEGREKFPWADYFYSLEAQLDYKIRYK
jgi:tetratricopeptide (TPR) repeat protein